MVFRPGADTSISRRSKVDAAAAQGAPFRMPVAMVNRPNLDFRGFAGQDRQRHGIRAGDAVRIVPSGKTSTVKNHYDFRWRPLTKAVAGQSVTLTLAERG